TVSATASMINSDTPRCFCSASARSCAARSCGKRAEIILVFGVSTVLNSSPPDTKKPPFPVAVCAALKHRQTARPPRSSRTWARRLPRQCCYIRLLPSSLPRLAGVLLTRRFCRRDGRRQSPGCGFFIARRAGGGVLSELAQIIAHGL